MRLFWQHNKKIMLGILLWSIIPGCLGRTVYASDQLPFSDENVEIIHNEETIDPFTGEVITDDEDEETEEGYQSAYIFNDSFYYDVTSDRYVYRFGTMESESVYCNIANGMFTNDPVSVSFGNGIRYDFYRDGKEVEDVNLNQMTEPGNYVFCLSTLDNRSLGTFAFHITDTYTNSSLYQIPDCFSITEALCNGRAQYGNTSQISMEEEGIYHIVIENDLNGKSYSYETIVDHTAPTLKLSDVNENMIAKSAVDISDLEEGVDLKIYWNDELISNKEVLSTPGSYTLVLTDEAGNITTYHFIIYLFFTVTSKVILALVGIAVLVLIIYLIVSRKSIRVR